MRAGVCQGDITPPIGTPLSGYAGRGPAEGIHDPLFATCLTLQSGDQRCMIISADILDIPSDYAHRIRAEIERQTGILTSHILICCSHTHYGPAISDITGGTEGNELAQTYRKTLVQRLVETAIEATTNLTPTRISVGKGQSDISVNRRERLADGTIILGKNPDGPCDREVIVARFDGPNGPIATIVNFACHPTTAAGQMRFVSADYIGPMRETVQASVGAPCLFLQGAAGDISPIDKRHSHEPAQLLGARLGAEVVRVLEYVKEVSCDDIALHSQQVDLPAMTCTSLADGQERVAQLGAECETITTIGADNSALFWANRRFVQAQEMLAALRNGTPLPPIKAELTVIRLGDLALAAAPGEIFNELGRQVKDLSPVKNTMFVGYTNGSIGYVPTPYAYAEGGYEVTHACRVDPAASTIIVNTLLGLL